MRFILTLSTDNAAFEDAGEGNELARILREVAQGYEGEEKLLPGHKAAVLDVNGNVVGEIRHTNR